MPKKREKSQAERLTATPGGRAQRRSGLIVGWKVKLTSIVMAFVNVIPLASGQAIATYAANNAPQIREQPKGVQGVAPSLPMVGWIVEPTFRCSGTDYNDHLVARLIVQNVPPALQPWLFGQSHGNPKFYPSAEPIRLADGSYEVKLYTGPSRDYDLYLFALDAEETTQAREYIKQRVDDGLWRVGMEKPQKAVAIQTLTVSRACRSLFDLHPR